MLCTTCGLRPWIATYYKYPNFTIYLQYSHHFYRSTWLTRLLAASDPRRALTVYNVAPLLTTCDLLHYLQYSKCHHTRSSLSTTTTTHRMLSTRSTHMIRSTSTTHSMLSSTHSIPGPNIIALTTATCWECQALYTYTCTTAPLMIA